MANLDEQKAKKAICANYEEFYEKCKKNKTIINTRLEKLNAYFKDKYSNFPGLSLTREKILTFIGPTLHDTFSNYTDNPFTYGRMGIRKTTRHRYNQIRY